MGAGMQGIGNLLMTPNTSLIKYIIMMQYSSCNQCINYAL